ncbi:MAG: hypothetical protein CVU48_08450 [Candidatus Cloacimonetes bacterium HGW-Cloacimonetes-1]|nr:MAG: hypothetical protein CVU48_08450 [Candidatus Cloacimonetes bacterium HGW-Cloacimonetes-1]
MKHKYAAMAVCFLFVLGFALTSCFESSTEPDPNDMGGANTLARQAMVQLNQVVIDMSETSTEINTADDLMAQATFNQIEAKFNQALALDTDNPMANLGIAMLEIVRINYDDELWSMIDDADSMGTGSKRIINNQYQFLAQAPLRVMNHYRFGKDNSFSIMRVQNYIKASVLPRLDNSISRLNHAVAMADSNSIMIDTGEEYMEVDCGEIYAFRASVRVLSAAFNLMVAYDFDMIDSNNSYNWMLDMINISITPVNTQDPYNYSVNNGVLTLDYWNPWDYEYEAEEAYRSQVIAKTVKYNLDHNPNFGKLTDPGRLTAARNAILGATADVRLGVDYIMNETDSQANDVIKIENIISMNNNIPPTDSDAPNFTATWQSIEDITNWLDTVISSSYAMDENGVQFTVNLGAFFGGAVTDIEEVLPYFHWNDPAQSWVQSHVQWQNEYYTSTYGFFYNGNYVYIDNITKVISRRNGLEMNMGYNTDSVGNMIGDSEMPFLPDYTFKGILPGMTRAKYLQLFG